MKNKKDITLINEYYDVIVFEEAFDKLAGLLNFKMDPYYELLRISRKNKNRTTNISIYVYGYHKANNRFKEIDKNLTDSELFLKAAFIQQISDGIMLVKEDVHGLLDSPQEESINWRRILE